MGETPLLRPLRSASHGPCARHAGQEAWPPVATGEKEAVNTETRQRRKCSEGHALGTHVGRVAGHCGGGSCPPRGGHTGWLLETWLWRGAAQRCGVAAPLLAGTHPRGDQGPQRRKPGGEPAQSTQALRSMEKIWVLVPRAMSQDQEEVAAAGVPEAWTYRLRPHCTWVLRGSLVAGAGPSGPPGSGLRMGVVGTMMAPRMPTSSSLEPAGHHVTWQRESGWRELGVARAPCSGVLARRRKGPEQRVRWPPEAGQPSACSRQGPRPLSHRSVRPANT